MADCTHCGGNGETITPIANSSNVIIFHKLQPCEACRGSGVTDQASLETQKLLAAIQELKRPFLEP